MTVRPEARRSRTLRPDQRSKLFAHRTGTGEKTGTKRMAETGSVFDVAVPDGPPRTPEQIMHPGPDPRQRPPAPAAVNRWYTCGITVGCSEVIAGLFGHADRRDPGHARPWIALADGSNHQIKCFQDQAASRGITLTILIDFVHVLELSTGPDPPESTSSTSAQITSCHRC